MTLSIKDNEVDQLATKAAAMMGATKTAAVKTILTKWVDEQERRKKVRAKNRFEALMEISRRCAALPVYDDRTPDEILGYDENGLPT